MIPTAPMSDKAIVILSSPSTWTYGVDALGLRDDPQGPEEGLPHTPDQRP